MRDNLPENAERWLPCIVTLGIVLVLGAAVSLTQLNNESPWFDEIVSIQFLDAPTLETFIADVRTRSKPVQPIYFILEYYWAGLVGAEPARIRCLSILFFLGSLAVLVHIARLYGGTVASLVAGLFAIGNQAIVFYGQDIRMYSLFALLGLLYFYSYLRLAKQNGWSAWLLHSVTVFLMIWTHVLGAALVVSMTAVFLLFHFRERRRCAAWIAINALAVASIAPWYRSADVAGIERQLGWADSQRALPDLFRYRTTLYVMLQHDLSDPVRDSFSAVINVGYKVFFPVVGVLVAGMLILAVRGRLQASSGPRRRTLVDERPREALAVLLAGIAGPIAVLSLGSLAVGPMYRERYFVVSFFLFFLLPAITIARLPARWRAGSLVIVCVLTSASMIDLVHEPIRAPWREVVRALEDNPGTAIYSSVLDRMHEQLQRAEISYQNPAVGERIVPVMSANAIQQYAHAAADSDQRAVFAFWRYTDLVAFESFLDESGIEYDLQSFRSKQPIFLIWLGATFV